MQIKINGETKNIEEGESIQSLVEQLALASDRLAIELNSEVVRRADWSSVSLKEGDRVEIVHFVGGG